METTIDKVLNERKTPPNNGVKAYIIPASIAVNLLIAVACLFLANTIVNFEVGEFGNLGKPVQIFVGVILLIPPAIAIFSSWRLLEMKSSGRYAALVLQYGGFVLSAMALLHLWGFFLSFESAVDTIMANSNLILGFALAYMVYWIGGRFAETSEWRRYLDNAALIIGGLTIVALVFASDVLHTINSILDTYGNVGTWVATITMIVLGFLAYQMLYMGDTFYETPQQRDAWQGWLMLSPNIIGFLFFFAGPLLLSFYISFTDSSVGQTPEIIGFDNYAQLLSVEFQWKDDATAADQSVLTFGYTTLTTVDIGGRILVVGAKDAAFWRSIFNTILFCLLLVPLSTIPALGLSIVLNSKLPGVKFFRALYFLPSVAAVVGTALIWRWLYDPTIGYFNYLISQVVTFLNSIGFSIQDPEIAWLTGPGVMLFSIVFLAAWQVVGFNTVLFLAGLQGIPNTLYEAAMIDGANRWQQFRNVTLPMLGPTTFFVITTTVITGLQVFNEPYALFPVRPLPEAATTGVYYIYNQGFNRFAFGYASSVAWLLFLIIFMVTFIQFRLQNSDAYDS